MPSTPASFDQMRYDVLTQQALRGIIRAALDRAAKTGLPGDHHFYISFKTQAPGVSGAPEILSRYPDEMTIVLQHEFWDLKVDNEGFSVTLSFGGKPKVLTIPFSAVTLFNDPAVKFGLQFDVSLPAPPALETSSLAAPEEPAKDTSPTIVSLDQFRKK